MIWEQNGFNTNQTLVCSRGEHVPGDFPMPTSTHCPHQRGVCSTQTPSVTQEQGFFLIYTLWNTPRAFKCCLSQAAATAVTTKSTALFQKCLSALWSSNIDQETFILTSLFPSGVFSAFWFTHELLPLGFPPQRYKGLLVEKYQFIKRFIFPTRNIRYLTSHVTAVNLTVITGTVLGNCYNKKCS